MTLLLLAAIGAAVVGFVLYPVLGREASAGTELTEKTHEMKRLAEEKARILASIKDLDFEHRAGKLTDEDYRRVRDEDMARVAHIMARLESLSSAAPSPKRDEAPEPKPESGTACRSCRRSNPVNARFCLHCGERIADTVTCPKCGTELPGEARFCISCGEAIQK